MTTLQEACTKALEAITKALVILDSVYIDVVVADNMPTKGLLDSRKICNESIESLKAALAQQGEHRCTYCDGTGDVHGIDGEWRGTCPCAAAPAPVAQQGEQQPVGMPTNWKPKGIQKLEPL